MAQGGLSCQLAHMRSEGVMTTTVEMGPLWRQIWQRSPLWVYGDQEDGNIGVALCADAGGMKYHYGSERRGQGEGIT